MRRLGAILWPSSTHENVVISLVFIGYLGTGLSGGTSAPETGVDAPELKSEISLKIFRFFAWPQVGPSDASETSGGPEVGPGGARMAPGRPPDGPKVAPEGARQQFQKC